MGQNAGYFNKANQRYSFLFFFYSVLKKLRPKKDKRVMLSHLLYFNKCLEFDFFLTPSKIPTRASLKQTHWKLAAFAYYHREKPNLKSLS